MVALLFICAVAGICAILASLFKRSRWRKAAMYSGFATIAFVVVFYISLVSMISAAWLPADPHTVNKVFAGIGYFGTLAAGASSFLFFTLSLFARRLRSEA